MEYYKVKSALDEIAARITQNAQRLTSAGTLINTAVNELTSMETEYGPVVTAINDAIAADPDDEAWKIAKAEVDKLVAEFNVAKTDAQAKKAAFDAA